MDDIINGLAEVSVWLENFGKKEYHEKVEKACDEIAKHRWIPVSERLPEREQIPFDCLVALKSGTVHEATFLDVDPVHRWCTELHYFNTGDVIAWMPLPQPPKEGDPG